MENDYIAGNNNINTYQSVFIFTPNVTLRAFFKFEKKIQEIIGENNITKIEKMGIKQLAYGIKNFKEGFYVVVYFKSDFTLIEKLENYYRINHNILKFITVKEEV